MKISRWLLMASLMALISACSSKMGDPQDYVGQVADTFRTDIKHNGLKLFTYKATLVQNKSDTETPLPHQTRAKQKQRQASRGPDLSGWTQQIEHGLNSTIEMTGYCRDGYIELSRLIEHGRAVIRGECNEGANDKDREKFAS